MRLHPPRSEVQAFGAFKLEDIDYIYYSNGQGQYCVFDNMKNFIRLNGNDKYAKLPGKLSDYWVGTHKGVCNDEVMKTFKPKAH
ncbi:hypothetical protein QUA35_23670 [Microcoleus sp. N9_B2]|uniref:hypothetical protein n=1 Tax=Microcoleus sp. N9_A2 TaxID=3055381 RepID=UPI002FD0C0F8